MRFEGSFPRGELCMIELGLLGWGQLWLLWTGALINALISHCRWALKRWALIAFCRPWFLWRGELWIFESVSYVCFFQSWALNCRAEISWIRIALIACTRWVWDKWALNVLSGCAVKRRALIALPRWALNKFSFHSLVVARHVSADAFVFLCFANLCTRTWLWSLGVEWSFSLYASLILWWIYAQSLSFDWLVVAENVFPDACVCFIFAWTCEQQSRFTAIPLKFAGKFHIEKNLMQKERKTEMWRLGTIWERKMSLSSFS